MIIKYRKTISSKEIQEKYNEMVKISDKTNNWEHSRKFAEHLKLEYNITCKNCKYCKRSYTVDWLVYDYFCSNLQFYTAVTEDYSICDDQFQIRPASVSLPTKNKFQLF